MDGLGVHPSLAVQFLVMVGVAIELGPYTDHKASVHLVYLFQHSLRVGVARCFKLMAAPLVFFPVVPVLDDVVNGDVAFPELRQSIGQFFLCLVAFTALPET